MLIDGVKYVKECDVQLPKVGDSKQGRDFDSLVGKKYFFRTVTYHMVGRVTQIYNNFIKLEDAAWVADSGRFMQFIKDGKVDEVEPVGSCYVNIDSVTDFFEWNHELFLEQK